MIKSEKNRINNNFDKDRILQRTLNGLTPPDGQLNFKEAEMKILLRG